MDQGPPKRRRLEPDAASSAASHSFPGQLSRFPGLCHPVPHSVSHAVPQSFPQAVLQPPYCYDFPTLQQEHMLGGFSPWPGTPAVSGNPTSFLAYQQVAFYQAQAQAQAQVQIEAMALPSFPSFPIDTQGAVDAGEVNMAEWVNSPSPLPPVPKVEPEIVCFGRVTAIAGRWEHHDFGRHPSGRFPVRLLSSSAFALPDGGDRACGKILTEHGQMVHGLLDEETLELHVTCTVDDIDGSTGAPSRVATAASRPCKLDIVLYGPADLHDELGTWFDEYEIYLQDPVECHGDVGRDVVYRNPQRLSAALDPASCTTVSAFLQLQSLSSSSQMAHLQDLPEQPDLLEILSSHVTLEEAAQPVAIQTSLKSHQKQALTFMLQRELGWSFHRPEEPDLWQLFDTSTSRVFLNRISDSYQADEPPVFSGGIIADPMGLGKTLTMIALVATDLASYQKKPVNLRCEDDEDNRVQVPATLIVIPPPLIGSWEEQLVQHVGEGQLQCRRHHGKTKLASIDELRGVNVVVTSYHTVSAEWKAGRSSVLFSVHWRRIILDEAHFIRNGNARMAKAACALSAMSRWAVTGTPIQNRLGDLAALLAFIRAHPYTDPKVFDADIARLWKSGEDEKAATRLKTLSSYLILRRPKTTINLPTRRDRLWPIDLAPAERALYNTIHAQALAKIDEATHKDSESSRAGVYANALQKIESLRLVCDLGLHYHTRAAATNGGDGGKTNGGGGGGGGDCSEQEKWNRNAQNVFNTQRDLGPIACQQCLTTLELTETLLVDDSLALLSRCLKFTCSDCARKLRPPSSSSSAPKKTPRLVCGHQPPCPTAWVSTSSAIWEETPDALGLDIGTAMSGSPDEDFRLPSKIEALLADLRTLPPDTKCIVFSTWRLTLDIIKRGLDQLNMPSIRFDGKVPQKERQTVVDRFRADPTIRVMLLTLSCGAVGLTLTAATRAYLMEPHWNPTLEEQALARIHRLGQTKEVTTVRFYVRDSFEEQVMKLQESKKRLAGVLLSHHDTGQVDDNLDGLHKLRSLL